VYRRVNTWIVFAAVVAGAWIGANVFGQAEPVVAAGTAEANITWSHMMEYGGIPMKVIIALSVGMIALFFYFVFVMRRQMVTPRGMKEEILDKISSGNLSDARLVCSQKPSPLAEVTLAGLNYVQAVPMVDPSLLQDVFESEGKRQGAAIQDPTQYMLDIGVVAPMIGLLGTVIGMFRAFQGVAAELAQARPVMLAEGVSMALVTTAAGLVVAILAMIIYALFRGISGRLISHLEASAREILTAILRTGEHSELS